MSLVLGHALAETCLLIKHLAQGKALGKSLSRAVLPLLSVHVLSMVEQRKFKSYNLPKVTSYTI